MVAIEGSGNGRFLDRKAQCTGEPTLGELDQGRGRGRGRGLAFRTGQVNVEGGLQVVKRDKHRYGDSLTLRLGGLQSGDVT